MVPEHARNHVDKLNNLDTWHKISFDADKFILYNFFRQVYNPGTESSSVNSRDIIQRKLLALKSMAGIVWCFQIQVNYKIEK